MEVEDLEGEEEEKGEEEEGENEVCTGIFSQLCAADVRLLRASSCCFPHVGFECKEEAEEVKGHGGVIANIV